MFSQKNTVYNFLDIDEYAQHHTECSKIRSLDIKQSEVNWGESIFQEHFNSRRQGQDRWQSWFPSALNHIHDKAKQQYLLVARIWCALSQP